MRFWSGYPDRLCVPTDCELHYSLIITNKLLQSKLYILIIICCYFVLYSKIRFILLADLNQIFKKNWQIEILNNNWIIDKINFC